MTTIKDALQSAMVTAIAKSRTPSAPAALATTLTEWASDDLPHANIIPKEPTMNLTTAPDETGKYKFQPTNNVTQRTFEMVRDNPGITHKAAKDALLKQGFKVGSVDSLLYQMLVQGLFKRTADGGYEATSKEFPGLKSSKAMARLRAEQDTAKRKAETNAKRSATMKAKIASGAAPLPGQPREKKGQLSSSNGLPNLQPLAHNRADQILEGLSIFEAKQVYDRLKTMFKD